MKVRKIKYSLLIFSKDKAKKRYPPFFGTEEVFYNFEHRVSMSMQGKLLKKTYLELRAYLGWKPVAKYHNIFVRKIAILSVQKCLV
jgi:hypothetical protein